MDKVNKNDFQFPESETDFDDLTEAWDIAEELGAEKKKGIEDIIDEMPPLIKPKKFHEDGTPIESEEVEKVEEVNIPNNPPKPKEIPTHTHTPVVEEVPVEEAIEEVKVVEEAPVEVVEEVVEEVTPVEAIKETIETIMEDEPTPSKLNNFTVSSDARIPTDEEDGELKELLSSDEAIAPDARTLPSVSRNEQNEITAKLINDRFTVREQDYISELIERLENDDVTQEERLGILRDPLINEYRGYERAITALNASADISGLNERFNTDKKIHLEQGFKSSNGELLSMRSVGIDSKDKGIIKGQAAILAAANFFKVGDVVHIPLIHSGFWITITPPTETDLILLYNDFAMDKATHGRLTFGLTFSNLSVKINETIFEFLKRYVTATTIKGLEKKNDWVEHFKLADLPIAAWGLARAMYPNGFLFRRICSHAPECDYIEERYIALEKLLVVDDSTLSTKQRELMSRITARSTALEEVLTYQKDFEERDNNVLEYKGAKITFGRPTVEDHVSDGIAWVNEIDEKLTSALAENEYDDLEQTYLLDQFIKATFIKNWSHFVKEIEFNGSKIVARKDIAEVLDVLAKKVSFYDKFSEFVINYRNETVSATIGIQEFHCPKCGKLNTADSHYPHVSSVVPIDVMNTFFLMFYTRYQMATGDLENE